MARLTVNLEYTVWLTNRADVDYMQQQAPNGWVDISPDYSCSFWGIAIQFVDETFHAPCCRSPLFIRNNNNYPRNVGAFVRKSGGWFGISWLFGDETTYHWVATYKYAPPPDEPTIEDAPVQPVAIAQRRWVQGFEIPPQGESNNASIGNSGNRISRDASRHIDGYGLSLRGDSATVTRAFTNISGTAATTQSWERFYIRIRKAPDATYRLWRCAGSVSSAAGAYLNITTGLNLNLQNVNALSVATDLGTGSTTLALNTWYRIDIVFKYLANAGVIQLYINRLTELSYGSVGTTGAGLGQAQNHVSSDIGNATSNAIEIDIDDWINSDWPATETSSGRFVGLDWLNGSKVALVRPTGFTTDNTGWAGDWRTLCADPVGNGDEVMSSSTSGAVLSVNTDIVRAVSAQLGSVGVAAINIAAYIIGSADATDGSIDYRINGGTLSQTNFAVGTGTSAQVTIMYRPSGVTTPDPITQLELRITKAASANQLRVYSLQAAVEILGIFGSEDVAAETVGTPTAVPPRKGIHNSPYPLSPWARQTLPFIAPYVVHSGTYIGNGTGQSLTFRTPVHWFWVRRTDAAAAPGRWFSSMVSSHMALENGCDPTAMSQALIDPDFYGTGDLDAQEIQALILIQGNDARSNLNGATYQYVAVEDAAERFMHNGAFAHRSSIASVANALYWAGFTPIVGFFQREAAGAGTTASLYFKGVGHATDAASVLSAAETATVLTFDTGSITSKTPLNNDAESTAYNLWRRSDGTGASDAARAVQMVSYTGDGTGARTISLTPASGRRPLFAIVTPHNGTSWYRDPTHSGGTSTRMDTWVMTTATAITGGGIDQIIVGATLNTVGIVYDVFVLPGSETACNDGWSCNGEFIIEPNYPPEQEPATPPGTPTTTPTPPSTPSPGVGIVDPSLDSSPFEMESDASKRIRLANLCSRVLYRLGDSDQKIWTIDEIDSYLTQAALQMATLTRLVWDQAYLENVPSGFHCTHDWELDYPLQYGWNYGVAACTYDWELEIGDDAGLWYADDTTYANHTCPAELLHMTAVSASVVASPTVNVPTSLIEIERATWDQRSIDAVSPRDLMDWDSRFEKTQGETFAYTWRKDGNRKLRKVRVPNQLPDLMDTTGDFGIARDVEDASGTTMTGTWGIPRRIEGWHPMGSTVGWGTPRRFYYDQRNFKIEFWRKFDAECDMTNLKDGEIQRFAGELPRRYFMYMADYCQWKALWRQGAGQDYKLGQLYKDRWERNLGRLAERVRRRDKERLMRLGGVESSPRTKPPRPKLPWQYGSKVR